MKKQDSVNYITQLKLFCLVCCMAVLTACGGGANSQAADPTVPQTPIAYVKRPVPTDNTGAPVSGNLTVPEDFHPGAHLMVKTSASLSAQEVDVTTDLIGDTGDVRDPSFSPDGTKLLFALHKQNNVNNNPPVYWDIYVYDLTKPLSQTPGSENPKQLTMDNDTQVATDDIEPAFIPGKRIIFSSTRSARTKGIETDENAPQQFAPTIEATNTRQHAFNLHTMALDGSDVQQIGFNMSSDLYPTVIRNIPGLQGRIMFVRWEHFPGSTGQLNQFSLYTMNPDGTDVQILYGHNSHNTGAGGSSIEFTQPRETSMGDVMVLARQMTGTFDGGDPWLINVSQYADNIVPVVAGNGSGPAQTSTSNYQVSTQPGISPPGRYSSVFPLLDGTNRALVSYSLCLVDVTDNTTTITQTLGCQDPKVDTTNTNLTITEAPPRYGIFIYDVGSDSFLPVTTPLAGIYYTDVAAALNTSDAPYIANSTDNSRFGVLDIRSVYDMDGSYNDMGSGVGLAALSNPTLSTGDIVNNPTLTERPARFLRIVKGVYLPDNTIQSLKGTAYGVNRSQLMRQIIGYVPIDPDGSVRVKVPANVPLSISILDKNGRRIGNRHGSWLTVRPGETLKCNGCHDPASGFPHGRAAAQKPSINPGVTSDGAPFPGTDPNNSTTRNFTFKFGETMSEVRTNGAFVGGVDPLSPTPDIIYADVWTEATATRPVDAPFAYAYSLLDPSVPSPDNGFCTPSNYDLCRITINYETNIQPIWSVPFVDNNGNTQTCLSCHAPGGVDGNSPPAGDIDLRAAKSPAHTDFSYAYVNLLATHELEDANGTILTQDVLVNNVLTTVNQTTNVHSLNPGNAKTSSFFAKFAPPFASPSNNPHCTNDTNMVCQSWLSPSDLKLISEWVDIGAQNFNNPFDPNVPVN